MQKTTKLDLGGILYNIAYKWMAAMVYYDKIPKKCIVAYFTMVHNLPSHNGDPVHVVNIGIG